MRSNLNIQRLDSIPSVNGRINATVAISRELNFEGNCLVPSRTGGNCIKAQSEACLYSLNYFLSKSIDRDQSLTFYFFINFNFYFTEILTAVFLLISCEAIFKTAEIQLVMEQIRNLHFCIRKILIFCQRNWQNARCTDFIKVRCLTQCTVVINVH